MCSENRLKKVKLIIVMAALISVSLLSGCNKTEVPTDETTASETTTETTAVTVSEAAETTQKYTDEELDELAQNMPEIVFVLSHHYDDTNILGFFITNTGEIKMFDFRNIAPDEIYEVPDVYDRLEEAVCSEINPAMYYDEEEFEKERITEDELGTVSEEELIECYKQLLLVNTYSEDITYDSLLGSEMGEYSGYGIRYNEKNEKEIILLYSNGEYIYYRYDEYANQLFYWLRLESFPSLPIYHSTY